MQFATKISKTLLGDFGRALHKVSLGAFVLLVFAGGTSAGQTSLAQPTVQQPANSTKESHDPCCTVTIPSKPSASLPNSETKTLVQWNYDVERASAAALRSNKPLLIEFWAGWCAVCKVFDKQIFSDPQIAAEIGRKFIPVKVNFDANIQLDKTYGIKELPTVVFADSYGSELLRTFGSVKPAKFADITREFPADITRINGFDQSLAADRNNLTSMYGFAREASRDKLYQLSNTTYEHALKLETDPQRKDLALAAEGYNYIELKDPQSAIQIFKRCVNGSVFGPDKPLFMTGLGQAYAAAGERNDARKLLAAVVEQYPNTPQAAKAKQALRELQ